MSCATCVSSNGLPKGCKNNGHCRTGICNKLSTYNWLADIPSAFEDDTCPFIEVSFKNGSRKDFFQKRTLRVDTGDLVVVETGNGHHIGEVSLSGELVRLQMRKKGVRENSRHIRNVLRLPSERDIERWEQARAREYETMVRARAIARQMKIEMKIGDVEFQADRRKATFYYTADGRVDFRELIKVFAKEFRVKIEMRQIGARQEAGRIGGIGTCGRELCCSTWLTDFKSVTTSAARYQNLAINQSKLSGQCGRLKCCLNYELDTYIEAMEHLPKNAEKLETQKGTVRLEKTDILKELLYYTYKDSNTYIPLTADQVRDIQAMNQRGEKPDDLALLAAHQPKVKREEETDFTDVVGQVSLKALEKKTKKKRKRKGKRRRGRGRGRDQS